MNRKAARRYEMLIRVDRFGKEHADAFRSSRIAGSLFAAVDAAIQDAADAAERQIVTRGRAHVASAVLARQALRASLAALSRTVRSLAVDAPGLREPYRLPKTNGQRTLLVAARAAATHARGLSTALEAHGLASTFLDDLDARIAEFNRAIDDRSLGRQMQNVALAKIETALAAGCTAVRRLDAVVFNVYADNPQVLAAWDAARRIVYARVGTIGASRES